MWTFGKKLFEVPVPCFLLANYARQVILHTQQTAKAAPRRRKISFAVDQNDNHLIVI